MLIEKVIAFIEENPFTDLEVEALNRFIEHYGRCCDTSYGCDECPIPRISGSRSSCGNLLDLFGYENSYGGVRAVSRILLELNDSYWKVK